MPARIQRLPRDARGFPIPQAVKRDPDGTPRLAIIDPKRAAALHKTHSCGICGERLLRSEKWFVGAPSDIFDSRSGFADPPMHEECVAFALRVCPYLSALVYVKEISRPDTFVALMTNSYQYREKLYRHEDRKPENRKPGRYPVYYARKPWLRATLLRAGQEITNPYEVWENLDEILEDLDEPTNRSVVARLLGVDSQEAPPHLESR
jgi:hypothetical protein